MAHSSWGSGWPNCQPSKINSGFVVSGTKFPGGMRNELVELTSMLVQECKNRGYRFGNSSDPSYGCWGYSCRAISGSNNPSNHSWGLAVDINAPSNPYTSPLVTDMPGWMPDLWNQYGFRWGGDYSGSKDAMHMEFMESVSAAADYTNRARSAGLGGGSTAPPTTGDEFDMASLEDLRAIVREELYSDQFQSTVATNVWIKSITDEGANTLLARAAAGAQVAAEQLPHGVWDGHFEATPDGGSASVGDILAAIYRGQFPA